MQFSLNEQTYDVVKATGLLVRDNIYEAQNTICIWVEYLPPGQLVVYISIDYRKMRMNGFVRMNIACCNVPLKYLQNIFHNS